MKRLLRSFLLALILVGLMGGTAYLCHIGYDRLTTREPRPLENHAVDSVVATLEKEYVHPVETAVLLGGAVKGLKAALTDKKIAVKDLPRLVGQDRKAQLASYYQILGECEQRAQGKLTRDQLIYASLRGIVASLEDPYSDVFTPEERKEFDEEMQGGNFGGIGVYLEEDKKHGNRLTVTEPIEGTPAFKAGLRPGDLLTRINGEETTGMDVETAAKKIRGPVDSEVKLTIKREGKPEFTVSLKRAIIHVSSVSSEMLEGKIGYLRLRIFGDETTREFAGELKRLQEAGARGLILDLRNNGGGYVNAAQDVCSHFLKEGELIVSVVNNRASRNETLNSTGESPVDIPVIVLINRFSASASEITAGALQDHHVATLMGETSYGKASVQTIVDLDDGGAVKYTVAHYLTPEGRDIHHKGIEPDVKMEDVERSPGEADPMLQAARQRLQKSLVRL